MRTGLLTLLTSLSLSLCACNKMLASDPPEDSARATLILVQGAAGTEEFGRNFDDWSQKWQSAAEAGEVTVHVIGGDAMPSPKQALQQALTETADESERPLWVVLIGHGTFDGRTAKFNLSGPDVSAKDLAAWLEPVQRPLTVINCASASSPFIDRLSEPDRIILTATRSGSEVNYARFGGFLADAIGELTSDLDKDGQVSLLEAYLTASRQTAAYYEGRGQLATEHALLEDTGDARGVTADFFEGIRPVKAAEGGATLDGHVAHQWHLIPSDEERLFPNELRPRRDELELEIVRLHDRKSDIEEDVYYASLERLLVELARLYEQADNTMSQDDLPPQETIGDAPE